eukprot:CAMPEP_0183740862 /NCGR_PEP_ID=MMETSP0737-20130205/60702_1 /TAXON_ID=385413 /ORGANISM="Thalassiosira miniscula, Strain CCMP1093" /LENGTH=535 /DNA_ID=CAMNT_0025976023 /DNA_START=247 /DNA_END=1854 /DNA_ORIENTATION=-
MAFPTSCIRAAANRSVQCRRLQSIFPRKLDTHSLSTLSRIACHTPELNREYAIVPSTTIPLLSHGQTIEKSSLVHSRRHFSTAVATEPEYSSEDEIYENSTALIAGGYRKNEDMPRLQALRERLRVEKHEGFAMQQPIQPNEFSLEDTRALDDYSTNIANENILTDTHGRHHNYLRISLSERCNLRCQYCMPPEGVPLSPSSKLLTDDEIMRLVHLFVKNGVNKVRLTGGEPLLRPNLVSLVRSISDALASNNDVSDDMNQSGLVGITTNGISLSRHIDGLVDAGLTGVNISLDTLCADRYAEITRRNGLDKVMRAIEDCIHAFREKYGHARVGPNGTGGSRIKINCVVMKGFNDDELSDFVRMANERFGGDVDMRFIEWMPFNDNGWNTSRFVSYKDMMDKIADEGMPLQRIDDGPNDTTKWWSVQTQEGENSKKARIGFITSMSEHFCSSCNRLRITADGKIKVCLFGSNEKEVSLRDIMRQHQHEDLTLQEEELSRVIFAAVQRKTFALGGHGNAEGIAEAADNRPMTLIGG